MIDSLVKNIHYFLLLYAVFIGFTAFEDLTLKLENTQSEYESTEVQLTKVRRTLRQVKQFEKNLQDSKNRVSEIIKKIETIQKQLPPTINDAQVSGTLTQFADELRMKDPSPTPKQEVDYQFYASKNYIFDVKGTFLQFLIFYEKLEKLASEGRILNVQYLRMKVADDADDRSRFQILNLSTTVEAYRYKEFSVEEQE